MARRKSKKPRKRAPGAGRRFGLEWIGARVVAPFTIEDGGPRQPDLVLWLELPNGQIVAHDVVEPDAPPERFGDALLAAMQAPMVGAPRQPRRIRVADEAQAAEVRRVTRCSATITFGG